MIAAGPLRLWAVQITPAHGSAVPTRSDRMVALSWADRLARLPLSEEQLVEGLARAIYMTHRQERSPTWDDASEASREWVLAQARTALEYLRSLIRLTK
jgi:hypothetical protein